MFTLSLENSPISLLLFGDICPVLRLEVVIAKWNGGHLQCQTKCTLPIWLLGLAILCFHSCQVIGVARLGLI